MADTKISALPAATTPLAGTEVLPIVQSSVTVKVSVDNLTVKNIRSNATNGILQIAGPAAAATRVMTTPDANFTVARTDAAQSFTGNQTLSTGNLVIGTSGQGIDFSATPGTGTSELLADYEEGTWTPSLSTTGTSLTSVTYDPQVGGRYVRVGNVVHVQGYLRTDAVTVGAATGLVIISGLPFTSAANTGTTANGQSAATLAASETWATNNPSNGRVSSNSTSILLYYRVTANGDSSPLPVSAIATGADSNITNFTATYVCA